MTQEMFEEAMHESGPSAPDHGGPDPMEMMEAEYEQQLEQGLEGIVQEAMLEPDAAEVDALCERLNLDEAPVDWRTCEHDWQDSHGPMTGCGVEYWFRCRRCGASKYRSVDQDGSTTDEVCPPDDDMLTGVHRAIRRIHDLLYLDTDGRREFYSSDKAQAGDIVAMVADIIAEYIPQPSRPNGPEQK